MKKNTIRLIKRILFSFTIIILFSIYIFPQNKSFDIIKISKYNDKQDIVSLSIETYNTDDLLIQKNDFLNINNKLISYSHIDFFYEPLTNLLTEKISRTPNIMVPYKISSYTNYSITNNIRICIEEYTQNYINNNDYVTLFYYDEKGLLKQEKIFRISDNIKFLISEINYYYINGNISEKLIYSNTDDDDVFEYKSEIYYYNKNNNLYEIVTYDSNKNPLSKTILIYDLNFRILRKEIYELQLILSSDDMSFDERFVLINRFDYEYL